MSVVNRRDLVERLRAAADGMPDGLEQLLLESAAVLDALSDDHVTDSLWKELGDAAYAFAQSTDLVSQAVRLSARVVDPVTHQEDDVVLSNVASVLLAWELDFDKVPIGEPRSVFLRVVLPRGWGTEEEDVLGDWLEGRSRE